MKKYIISLSLIVVFAFYAMLSNQNSVAVVAGTSDSNQNSGASAPQNASNPTATAATGSSPATAGTAPNGTPKPSPTPATAALYKDGSYTGNSVDAYFGNVQVAATIQGGKLTNVTVPVYPTDRTTSARINNRAIPMLIQEAISAQSAQVDFVSGATQTSQGFQQSLASALVQAKN